jgi:septal ring factor EnvC (AmiA/AmiB activator)
MASQERLSVDAAAARLGISPDAVRSRIKRGTLWAVRRDGRVQVVLRDPVIATNGSTHGPDTLTGPAQANGEAVTRLRAEIGRQKHRVRELERDRERLSGELGRQQKFLDLEFALRARLQDQLDRLNERLADALPELLDDPTERADRLWNRLGRQVDRLDETTPKRDG